MKTTTGLFCFILGALPAIALATAGDPVVSNVRSSQRAGTKLVDVLYDLTDADSSSVNVIVQVSTNGGLTYDLPANHFSGDGYGANVTPGTSKTIVWNAGADWDGHYSTLTRLKITADDGSNPVIPPDPATVATAPESGVVSLFSATTAFLYSGTNVIQTGVATGTIQCLQAAVLRGRVLDRSGTAISGVVVAVNDHPEFGQTLSRTDGRYDLAVNGGGVLKINFQKNSYLNVQRTIHVPWQEFVSVDDVTLIQSDSNVTAIFLPSTNFQVAYGTLMSDQDGARRVVVMFPTGVTASIVTRSGETKQVNALTTRFTEFTVGTNGPNAMPGDLPANIAYTYAIELGTEEAETKVAGKDVMFNTNVYLYIDNFLCMPIGIRMPMGYYDDDRGAWVPDADGRVIQLLGTNANGLARISVNTNGTESDDAALASLGFTDAERRQLSITYAPPTNSLWRFPTTHFSRKDPNPTWVSPSDAISPNQSVPKDNTVNNTTDQGNLGTIEMENQIFRESLPVVGTPFTLNYACDRMPGRVGSITIPLSDSSIPASLKRIDLQIQVAGCSFTNSFSPSANLSYDFTWDGRDVYGRVLTGEQPVRVNINYIYESYYGLPPDVAASWGLSTTIAIPLVKSRQDYVLGQEYVVTIQCSAPAVSQGLGGWTLSAHHAYDPVCRIVELGTGQRQSSEELVYDMVVTLFAGDGYTDEYGLRRFSGDGGPAVDASFDMPFRVRAAPDGSIYIVDTGNYRVRKVDTNGIITTVAGSITYGFYRGDGGPATNACLDSPADVAFASDGSFYIADHDNHVIRKVDTNGIITTVAGDGYGAEGYPGRYAGDGGPATNASLYMPESVVVAPDGTLYIADTANYRIRRVGLDGIIHTICGNGTAGFSGDGGAATNAAISGVNGMALALDGTLYLADTAANHRIRKIGTDGIIQTVAGKTPWGFSGDGGAATNAKLCCPNDITVGQDGSLYIAEESNKRIRRISPNGIITTTAGNGVTNYAGDNGSAAAASFNGPRGVSAAPDGTIYVCDTWNNRIRCLRPALPGLNVGEALIPSSDGQWIYAFNEAGRHLRTYNALTGAIMLSFTYNDNGLLTQITDADANITAVERNEDGTPTAIVGPYGQRTTLVLNGNGFLSSVENPAGETTVLGYSTNGLLTSVQGPKGTEYTYTVTYNAAGYVTRGAEPAGASGYTGLGRSSLSNGFQVASTSALGRVTTSRIENLTTGDRRRLKTLPDNTQIETVEMANGTETNRMPDGSLTGIQYGPDPRFGMKAPLRVQQVVRLPSGLAMTNAFEKGVVLSNSSVLSLTVQTNKNIINGRTNIIVYTASGRETTTTTPAGRQMRSTIDSQGRPTSRRVTGLETLTNTYDDDGRLATRTTGDRVATWSYDAAGFVAQIVDAAGRTNQFLYDAVGRVTNQTLPGDRTITYAYDMHGNMMSLTPPGRSAHTFAYTVVDLPSEYTPPAMDGVTNTTYYSYNADRQRTSIRKPGGLTISNAYNAAGQLSSVAIPDGTYNYYWQTNGLLAGIIAPSVITLTNSYDGSLLLASRWLGTVTGQVSRTYDNDFRIASLSVNGANTAAFQYDADSLLTNAGVCGLSRNTDNGLLTGRTLSNVIETLSYNAFGEVTNITATCNGTNLFAANYSFDKLGRITNLSEIIQISTNNFVYSYDPAGRLSQAITNATGTNTYQYDSNGNRTNWQIAGIASATSNDVQDRLQSTASSLQTNLYAFHEKACQEATDVAGAGIRSRGMSCFHSHSIMGHY